MRENRVFVVGYARTPFGVYNGALSSIDAVELASVAIKVFEQTCPFIDEIILGCVFEAGLGQCPATHAAVKAGIKSFGSSYTVNKVCASAVMLGADSIRTGRSDLIIAGGMDSMSRAPYLLIPTPGKRTTGAVNVDNATLNDSIVCDGLSNSASEKNASYIMAHVAQHTASRLRISRKIQDDLAIKSYRRALDAVQNSLDEEIVPVLSVLDKDEKISREFSEERLGKSKPCFYGNESCCGDEKYALTAGNSSSLADGAAVVLLASYDSLEKYNLVSLGEIVSYADASMDADDFLMAPAVAIEKTVNEYGIDISEIDNFDINEAFAMAPAVVFDGFTIKPCGYEEFVSKCNLRGGAVALGHPLGASGTRVLGSLLLTLKQQNGHIGVAAICNGGGGASAVLVKMGQ